MSYLVRATLYLNLQLNAHLYAYLRQYLVYLNLYLIAFFLVRALLRVAWTHFNTVERDQDVCTIVLGNTCDMTAQYISSDECHWDYRLYTRVVMVPNPNPNGTADFL